MKKAKIFYGEKGTGKLYYAIEDAKKNGNNYIVEDVDSYIKTVRRYIPSSFNSIDTIIVNKIKSDFKWESLINVISHGTINVFKDGIGLTRIPIPDFIFITKHKPFLSDECQDYFKLIEFNDKEWYKN